MRKLIPFLFFSIALSFPAAAQTDEKAKALARAERELARQEQINKDLTAQLEALESDLNATRGQLISAAQKLSDTQKEKGGLNAQIEELQQRQSALNKVLGKDRAAMAELLLALQRMRRMEPQALIFSTQDPVKVAQSALLMRRLVPSLKQRAQGLRTQLEEARIIAHDLRRHQKQLDLAERELSADQKKLADLLKRKQLIFEATHKDFKAQQEKGKRLAEKAENLQELMQALSPKPKAQNASATGLARIFPQSARFKLPVSGKIISAFNDPDEFGAPSQGLRIAAPAGAPVIAPTLGLVRFAGSFRHYGQMVIIEHEDGYHSLIAGLEKIDTVVGQKLARGEPFGFMPDSSGPSARSLYYELRYNGKPVDASRVF